jgi:hypothetical protein
MRRLRQWFAGRLPCYTAIKFEDRLVSQRCEQYGPLDRPARPGLA